MPEVTDSILLSDKCFAFWRPSLIASFNKSCKSSRSSSCPVYMEGSIETFFVTLYPSTPAQKFCRKMKNFKTFFDIINNHTCVHMLIKNFFKIFCFLAKIFEFSQKWPVKIFPKLVRYQLLSQIFIWHRWHLQIIFLD